MSGGALGQTSNSLALKARVSWSAFECSALAAKIGDRPEQERLFLLGYEEGAAFVKALESGEIPDSALQNEVPWLMRLLLQGPNVDFMLGRVYEAAVQSALKEILQTGDRLNTNDLQKTLAFGKYTRGNCAVLGRG